LQAHIALNGTTPPGQQIIDQDGQSDYEQDVNQTTGDVKAETQKPQDQKDHKDCPEHMHTSLHCGRQKPESGSNAPNALTNCIYLDAIAWAFALRTACRNAFAGADCGLLNTASRNLEERPKAKWSVRLEW
jgi:hypothetical protein